MKKLFLFFALLGVAAKAYALTPEELVYVPFSSYTDVSTNGNMLFSSAPIDIIGLTISSPAPNSSLTIYRSTTPIWKSDLSTQAFVWTDYAGNNGGPQYLDFMGGIKNSSYTYINKAGNAKLIIWVQCLKENLKGNEPYWGFCPGLSWSGELDGPMNRLSP